MSRAGRAPGSSGAYPAWWHVGILYALVRPDLSMWNLSAVQQSDQIRSRNIEDVRRLLRGELRLERHDLNGIARSQLSEHLEKRFQRFGRHQHPLALLTLTRKHNSRHVFLLDSSTRSSSEFTTCRTATGSSGPRHVL